MTEFQQLIAMLERAGVDFEITDGTYVHTEGSLFIFHISGKLKEVWNRYDLGGC